LAANIKARRAALNISQEKLAELIDVSSQMINCIEGCRTWVSDKTLIKLAGVLHVEVFQLLTPPDSRVLSDSLITSVHLVSLRQALKDDIDSRFERFIQAKAGS
jgi:transcriptional regulator with XRE-family HTH domain